MIVATAGGGIEYGEDPLEAAERELREESGLTAKRWTSLGQINSIASGIINSPNHLFLAQELTWEKRDLEEAEKIRIFKKKRRKTYRKTTGHRQQFTEVPQGVRITMTISFALFGAVLSGTRRDPVLRDEIDLRLRNAWRDEVARGRDELELACDRRAVGGDREDREACDPHLDPFGTVAALDLPVSAGDQARRTSCCGRCGGDPWSAEDGKRCGCASSGKGSKMVSHPSREHVAPSDSEHVHCREGPVARSSYGLNPMPVPLSKVPGDGLSTT